MDGDPVAGAEERVVYALHKPPGVVSTARDPGGHPTVVSLVDDPRRLYPVGRLDADAGGLILLTNDGELANRLTHPRYEVPKTYRVRVGSPPVREPALRRLREGVELDDGMTAPAKVRRVSADTLELTIHEGRNRQVKRMCEAVGHRVVALRAHRASARSRSATCRPARRGGSPRPRSSGCERPLAPEISRRSSGLGRDLPRR